MAPFPSRLLAALLLTLALPAPAQPVTVEYRDKPPYSYTDKGQPTGFLIERTQQIFKRAGIEAQFQEVPIRRTLSNLQANAGRICSPGLYKNPEREAFARFSLPIHHDKPHVVLAHQAAAAQIRSLASVRSLIADPRWSLGVMSGVSYGQGLDAAIAAASRAPERAQLSPLQLAALVSRKRVDYMLIDEEDLSWLRHDPEFAALGLQRIAFTDMPAGERRYIACSMAVEPALMHQIDRAIRELLPDQAGD
jgi:uncharacterized protein (TIGR02285 family)